MNISGFDWDHHNTEKVQKHGLTIRQIEEFLHGDLFIRPDDLHSNDETRFIVFGKYFNRYIYVSLTIRAVGGVLKFRVISARYANKKEIGKFYEENKK